MYCAVQRFTEQHAGARALPLKGLSPVGTRSPAMQFRSLIV